MPRAAMSVATRTRTLPLRKASSARTRAFCALLPCNAAVGDAGLGQIAADAVGTVLGAGEDEHAVHAAIGEQALEQCPLLLGADEVHALLDAVDRDLRRRDVDAHRMVENLRGELGDRRRHGGREQQRLALAPACDNDLPHVADEAHVEHAVGLVEHEDRNLVEPDMALVAEVEQASGRGDQDVDAGCSAFTW